MCARTVCENLLSIKAYMVFKYKQTSLSGCQQSFITCGLEGVRAKPRDPSFFQTQRRRNKRVVLKRLPQGCGAGRDRRLRKGFFFLSFCFFYSKESCTIMKRFDVHCSHEELQQMNKITQTQNTAYTRDTFDVSQTFRQVLNAVMSSRGMCVCVCGYWRKRLAMKTVRVLYACMLPIVQYSKLQSHTHMTPVAAGILTAKLLRSDKTKAIRLLLGFFFLFFF